MFAVFSSSLLSQIPKTISYQGVLTDDSGEILQDNTYEITFRLYTNPIDGEPTWAENQNIELTGGLFNVILGSGQELNIPFDRPYWLGITINGGQELSPRTALTAVPYSLGGRATAIDLTPGAELEVKDDNGNISHQLNADGTGSHQGKIDFEEGIFIPSIDTLHFVPTDLGMYIGPTATPPGFKRKSNHTYRSLANPLIIKARQFLAINNDQDAFFSRTTTGRGVAGNSSTNIGVFGSSSTAEGVKGTSSSGVGVFGESTSNYGIRGISNGDFAGVYGLSNTGRGMLGISTSNTGVKGLSTSGIGVFGESESEDGVRGFSTFGIGVHGKSMGNSAGVFGESEDEDGVRGFSNNGIGVHGESMGQSPAVFGKAVLREGILGESDENIGVYGISNGDRAGVQGRALNGIGVRGIGEIAGQFEGDVKITNNGQLSIDRVDPEISDQLLVWGSDKVVRYRSLGEILQDLEGSGGFSGCLNNLDFKVSTNEVPFFTVAQSGFANLKGSLSVQNTTFDSAINAQSPKTAIYGETTSSEHYAVGGKAAENGTGLYGESFGGFGVRGFSSSGTGVVGETGSASKDQAGVYGFSNLGIGIYGNGGTAAGLFEGDVLIEKMGSLKIDKVDSDNSDNILVWAEDKFVKTRSLNEALADAVAGNGFNGCLDNLDFKVTTNLDPFFNINQDKSMDLQGRFHINSKTISPGFIALSVESDGRAIIGNSSTATGVLGISNGGDSSYGVHGDNTSASVTAVGVRGSSINGIGVQGFGNIAGQFYGDVHTEQGGKLKIDQVDSENSDKILVWAEDKFVKTRSLNEALADAVAGNGFNGCLDNLDFKVTTNLDPFFNINQDKSMDLQGRFHINSKTISPGFIALSVESDGRAIIGNSSTATGVLGISNGGDSSYGVHGDNTSASVTAVGVRGSSINGIGVQGFGNIAGQFYGDVHTEQGGKLKIDQVDSENSDKILVWAEDKFVKTRSLNEALADAVAGNGFNGCLDNLDFKVTTNMDPFFTISQGGNANLKGSFIIEDQGFGVGLNAKSSSTAIMAEGLENGTAINASAVGEGFAVYATSENNRAVFGYSTNGEGVVGQTVSGSSESTAVSGIANAGVGIYGIGDQAAGLFDGNVLIENMGSLKIDKVDADNSDKILVWAEDKFVKTRSLGEAINDALPTDADPDPENEIQTLTKDGSTISLNQNGGTIALQDDDPTNELFDGMLNNQEFKVNFGGTDVFVVDNQKRVGVEGAFGANATSTLPAITGAAGDNASLFTFNNSATFPTTTIQNQNPNGPALYIIGNTFMGNGTNTFITFNPGQTQVAEFFGNVNVNGIISGTTKSFVIDHPLDPANKQLRHFSIESDQMTNIYKGNIILDENGEGLVTLPNWFEALNRDYTYQLTCIGGFANVYIGEEIMDNQFKIAGGNPGLKVSWEVSGIRHDKQALEIDSAVEITKNK
jgi:hypothetical protein